MRRSPAAPDRSVTEIGPGDYIKADGRWQRVTHNTALGERQPRDWTVTTEQGRYGMLQIFRYAKAEDMLP